MKVSVENLEKNMAKLTIEVEAEKLDKAIDAAYNKQKNSISLPGFRKGKVPRHMIEKMYGPEVFFEEAANILMQETYPEAYDQAEVDIVSAPKVDIVTLEKGKDFVYTAEVAVKPEVKLGKYNGITVTKIDTTASDDEIEAEIKTRLERSARTVEKSDAIVSGDTANIDFEGFIDDVAFEGGKGEGYDLTIGSGTFIPGFEDALIGSKAGDDVDVNVTFPEDYQAEDLAGKPAVFKCKVNSVTTKEVPELDDEFVADTTEFETVDEFKADVKKTIEDRKADSAKRTKEDEAIDKIIDDSKMDIPDAMLDAQVENMMNEFANQLASQGLSFEQYMQFTGSSIDAFREQVKPDAMRRIQSSLVLEAIADAENIEVSDDDVNAKVEEMAAMYGMDIETLKGYITDSEKKSIADDLKIEKALAFVMDNAKERKKAAKKADKEADAE